MNNQISKVLTLLPKNINPLEALEGIKRIHEMQLEIKQLDNQSKDLEIKEKVLMEELQQKYKLLHKLFDKVFSERTSVINKNFEIIDEGLKRNDKDIILSGLTNLSNVISASPFSNIAELTELIKTGKTIEL
ncbi:hypothetical protein [Algoriphagus hitonicola]|uniref:Uncharacterized protein n=1 Tax=Algoriphagus hitonicola TaxID=435880 RepID=A0A1I2VMH8_9BACT|nr:hypothetical protein [Algoriphagus hitonicola]SFG90525.1 hypothetical protein SAMN04487988_11038 [Algoriphagus hitonicola]